MHCVAAANLIISYCSYKHTAFVWKWALFSGTEKNNDRRQYTVDYCVQFDKKNITCSSFYAIYHHYHQSLDVMYL